MNWNIDKTTENERVIISNALYGIVDDLDRAKVLLGLVWEDYFGDARQEAIDSAEAETIGKMLYIVLDILCDATLAYKLTVADDSDPRVKGYTEAADRVKRAISVKSAVDSLYNIERGLSGDKLKAAIQARGKIGAMEDEQAVEAMKALAKSLTA